MGAHRRDDAEKGPDPRAFRQKGSAKRREQPLRRGQRLSRSDGDLGAAQSSLLWSEETGPLYALLDRGGFVDQKIAQQAHARRAAAGVDLGRLVVDLGWLMSRADTAAPDTDGTFPANAPHAPPPRP